jgi:signal peptidase II
VLTELLGGAETGRLASTVNPMTRERRLAYATIIVALAMTIDQAGKQWALSNLENGRTIDLLPTLELDLAFNSGFSFSTGSSRGNIIGLLVIVLSVFIGWQIWHEARPVRSALYAVILGGALGNLVDRTFRADDGWLSGKVVDFIDVSWYAVFNLADVFVVGGSVCFIVHEVWSHRHEQAEIENEAGSDADPTRERDHAAGL